MEENEGSEAQLGGGREIRGNMSERKPSFSPCSYLPCPPRLRGDARDPASPPVFRRPLQPSRRRPRTQAGPPKPQHVSTCQPPSADPIQRSSVKSLPAPLTLVTSINSCQSLSTLFDLAPPISVWSASSPSAYFAQFASIWAWHSATSSPAL